ncbi:protein adenylyltransferase SelO [Leeia aquatica]|uniref:Protein nucleotidyltransferase YdiU n=1 Tax=Leeia aquatica TaxID=2725557 RepID=A0A847SBS0_9NEIS|nr:YdiU family protein [Leeia aquatica]NLR76345.1 YdiU family protein [Leeia aquatica]
MPSLSQLPHQNRFARLPEGFFAWQAPDPLPAPWLVSANLAAARLLGLDETTFTGQELLNLASGNQLPDWCQPLASAYAGHQFGVFVPQLGDGRALLLGEVLGPEGHWEVQLKGAGMTPFSRHADGRAVLRSSIREYLCSEAMHGLGIPTTRALALVGSDLPVYRERAEPAAVVVRLAPSFVRFGHFEWFYARQQHDLLRQLADYVIDHDWPDLRDTPAPYLALLQRVIQRTAELMAAWQAVGFCHGVMNSDNMSILGLTLDYGPFGFLDRYDAGHICNHSDHSGRYAFDQQPGVALWNLQILASVMLPLLDRDAAIAALEDYAPQFEAAWLQRMQAKLGLAGSQPVEQDAPLIEATLQLLQQQQVDYTRFWRQLSHVGRQAGTADLNLRALFQDPAACDAWLQGYRQRLALTSGLDDERQAAMCAANPKYILRNHLAEQAIRQAEDDRDFSEVNRLLGLLAKPFEEQPELAHYAEAPPDWAAQICVSCSS